MYPDDPIPLENGARRQWVGKLLSCQVCSGWWVAALIVVFWSLVVVDHWLGWAFLIWWPAVAGVSALASLYDTGDDAPPADE